jgi:hypothetical protein
MGNQIHDLPRAALVGRRPSSSARKSGLALSSISPWTPLFMNWAVCPKPVCKKIVKWRSIDQSDSIYQSAEKLGFCFVHRYKMTQTTVALYIPECSTRPSSKAAASGEARRTVRYVEPLRDARTPLEDFFSILLCVHELKIDSQRSPNFSGIRTVSVHCSRILNKEGMSVVSDRFEGDWAKSQDRQGFHGHSTC